MQVLEEKPLLFGPDLSLAAGGPQFGGLVVDYEHNLSFMTVHGSGHMVPQFRPAAAFQMMSKLVQPGHERFRFAPPIPTDEAIAAMDDTAFDASLDRWTETAKQEL